MEEKQVKKENNLTKKVMVLSLFLGLLLITIGGSFAFFTYVKNGQTDNALTTGTLTFVYDEFNDQVDNSVSIVNAVPISFEEGMAQDGRGVFEFQVRAHTEGVPISYEVYLTKTEDSQLPEDIIVTYLTEVTSDEEGNDVEKKVSSPKLFSDLPNSQIPQVIEDNGKTIYNGRISSRKTDYQKTFHFRMWMSEDNMDPYESTTEEGDWIYNGQTFTVKVNVFAENTESFPPIMKSWVYNMNTSDGSSHFPETDFHTSDYASTITSIRFANKIEEPVGTIDRWDVSVDEDESVMAYAVPNIETEGTEIVIAANGEVYGNQDSSFAFANFTKLQEIDFTNFNTSKIENIVNMFGNCSALTNLNLSNWDTSNLTKVSDSFSLKEMGAPYNISIEYGPFSQSGIKTLNLSGWKNERLTDMSYMFTMCPSLVSIDLTNFNTSNATNMEGMFGASPFILLIMAEVGGNSTNINLTTITGIEDFDTTNVTNMSLMFAGTGLTSLDLSKWNTSNLTKVCYIPDQGDYVSSPLGMFTMSKIQTLNLSNWSNDKLTNMMGMFFMTSIESLNLTNFNTSSVTNMEGMFAMCSVLKTEITISGNITDYNMIFNGAATEEGSGITLNYIDDNTSTIVDNMIATANGNPNIVKGSQVSL